MSFSDFGPKKTHPSSPTRPSSSNNSSLTVISETLLQYQKNVGILEGIVQNLNHNNRDAVQQYEVQNHVLETIGQKINHLIASASKNNTAVFKLQRDFHKVELRVSQLQALAVSRIHAHDNNTDTSKRTDEIIHKQQALQEQILAEDRLNESIMREREEEIRNINKGMHTVNEIYKDLAHIVGEQQSDIDKIEVQMEESRANAESGLSQVEQANEKFGNNCAIM